MRGGRLIAPLIFAGAVTALGARAVHHARTPPFPIELAHHRKTELALDGVTMRIRAIDTLVTVKALQAYPGHLEVGPFELSPPAFLALKHVEVLFEFPKDPFVVEGKMGELRGRTLKVLHAVVRQGGREERRRVVNIDLETATAQGE